MTVSSLSGLLSTEIFISTAECVCVCVCVCVGGGGGGGGGGPDATTDSWKHFFAVRQGVSGDCPGNGNGWNSGLWALYRGFVILPDISDLYCIIMPP